jgi:membrane protein
VSLEVTALVEWWERFSQRPLIAHLLRTIDRFTVRGGSQFAAAIAYFSVLSLVPILMLAFSGLGLALTVFYPDYLTSLEDWLNSNLSAYGDLGQTMLAIVSSSLSNWAAIGLVGLAISFWSGANWMGNLKRAVRALMREDYDNPPKSLPLPLDLLANFGALLLLFLGVGLIWTATVATTTFGEQLGAILGVVGSPGWTLLARTVTGLLSLALATLLFWWMFRWFALTAVPTKLMWIGAFIGAVGLIVLQLLAGYLIQAFSRSLAATISIPLVVTMLFLNLFATLILYVAAWLATATVPAPHPEPQPEPDPEPVENKPGELYVSSEVAQKSMGVGLATGYGIGAATGLGLGALIAAVAGRVFARKRS